MAVLHENLKVTWTLAIVFSTLVSGVVRRFCSLADNLCGRSSRTYCYTHTIKLVYTRKTSIKRRVPNNRRVSNKRRGFEACVLKKHRVSIKRRVSNKRPGLLELQSCQSTSHTYSYVIATPTLSAESDNSLFFS